VFFTHLAVRQKVSASTQNQALAALLFLYRNVIGRDVGSGLRLMECLRLRDGFFQTAERAASR
jgi:hypothetical protein